ncbi:type IV pilin protein [Luteimonas cucumeris]|uniref:type IV pilin protein n=1 Tax=Luteimonas cucumeris TaxID=985012 RepID=UPI0024119141|nr:type IV pilin protein [Luteimonas cucumeris]
MRGFTLIELMVVVAVVAILASIALPSYQDSVRKSRRGQAKADLVELAQLLEREHTVRNSYGNDTTDYDIPFNQSPKTGTAHYTIALSNQSANTFTLTATPAGSQANDTCGNLTLNQAGAKTPATGGCW